MSVFAQPVPYKFSNGNWDTRREEVKKITIDSIARHCTGLWESIIDVDVLGPPDIEKKIGLTGGNIFHGECGTYTKGLPYHTPMKGFYMCGASTFPGGSVIGINGRNCAMKILEDENKK